MQIVALLVSLVLGSAYCAERAVACGEANGRVWVYSITEDGLKHQLVLDAAAVEHTPSWAPENGEPPLSVAKAAAAATSWAKQHYPNAEEIRVRSVHLESFQCVYNHWFYRVDLMLIAGGKSMAGVANFAGVMMDGSVVEPTQSK